ncbi:hypothetical protein [Microbacterium sp. 10M-3C3]|uniref:hypothetical protein n=1 Tax=Microbacterium sp. 10M-3C3 TaxID=2483401 RepID=UPI000F63FB61|nr:hypothetical protein [Microbacterium sp. 10M-3C3]
MSSTTPPEPPERRTADAPGYDERRATPPPAPAPSYAAPPPVDAAPRRREKGRATLGVVAFVVALLAIVVGSILTYIGGTRLGALAQYAQVTSEGATLDATNVPPEAQANAALGGILVVVGYTVMAVLGLWALIQGIVAAVRNRGRGWGIAAIVLAVLAVIPVSILLAVGTASTATVPLPAG